MTKKAEGTPAPRFRALVGFNYPDRRPDAAKGAEIRVEAGDVVELPEAIAAQQLTCGAVAAEGKE